MTATHAAEPNAVDSFLKMSPAEQEEIIHEMIESVGDDPAKRAEMKAAMRGLQKMSRDEEFTKFKELARQWLGGAPWSFFVNNSEEILEVMLNHERITEEEAVLYRDDKEAWTKILRSLWEEIGQLKDVEVREGAKLWLDWAPWEVFVQNSNQILEAMVSKGRVTPSQAETFSADKEAWLNELRVIWTEVSIAANNEEL
ncbi:hypothetical protein THAOC_13599 [Thalassiosira oceanica]|uniref:Uncharacterized protein n=1 Tax=Thalassiosira oceanica TaxID=159749 RepID=K0SJK4_THAOC|nr:hypothetical protein THAOC_13599 [Thalassiosira oceanica]|eukprot:EJK65525.1 hypothetical protein THAOC_13599 [Thalassiosira oceanica]